jgi:hypothetical protein
LEKGRRYTDTDREEEEEKKDVLRLSDILMRQVLAEKKYI